MEHETPAPADLFNPPRSMYEVPGSDPISDHSLSRYNRDNQQLARVLELVPKEVLTKEIFEKRYYKGEDLPVDAIKAIKSRDENFIEILKNHMTYLEDENLPEIISAGLESEDPKIRHFFANRINGLAEGPKKELLRDKAKQIVLARIAQPDPQSRSDMHLIQCVRPEERKQLIFTGIDSHHTQVINWIATEIHSLSEKERESILPRLQRTINDLYSSSDIDQKIQATALFPFLPEEELIEKTNQLIDSNEKELMESAMHLIGYLPDVAKLQIIRAIYKSSNSELQDCFHSDFSGLTEAQKAEAISEGLDTDSQTIQVNCAEYIADLPKKFQGEMRNKLAVLLAKKFADPDADIGTYSRFITKCPKDKRKELSAKLEGAIRDRLPIEGENNILDLLYADSNLSNSSHTKEVKQKAFDYLFHQVQENAQPMSDNQREIFDSLEDDQKAKVILIYIGQKNVGMIRNLMRDIEDLPRDLSLPIINTLIHNGFGNLLIEPPLYPKTEDRFFKKPFAKTDSETILFGGDLKHKAILRRITPQAFLAWKELYEDFQYWQNLGFDYVPIEPIQSFKLSASGVVDVYTGVLDINLDQCMYRKLDFLEELKQDASKIIQAVEKHGVDHGHIHEENFCLRYYRNPDGTPDFSKKPRIYMIDFDRAQKT